MQVSDIRDAKGRICGGVGRIELTGRKYPLREPAFNLQRVESICEIAGHQRGENKAGLKGGDNAVPIGGRCGCGRNRRAKIGHDDGSSELARSVIDDRAEDGPVAKMHMPVIRTAEPDAIDPRACLITAVRSGTWHANNLWDALSAQTDAGCD
jgi:hypothetical protein